ncbi:MAG: zinc ABC transporter solute-binding protein [Epsilonproteobacteria bacterium]|nr:zinc ABC transporter solute-binding protein [Campylobacterota bacterium]
MKAIVTILITALFAFAGVNVVVSIPPEKFFVKKIAKDLANVTVMLPPGASPATYSVKPAQLKALKDANVYFSIGVPFEKAWLNKFVSVNPLMRVEDLAQDIKKIPMEEGEHEGNLDPHVWLSPPLVILESRVILKTLISLDPKNADIYMKNYEKFVSELGSLDMKIMSILKDLKKREFIVFHPSFGYFAKAYNLTQIAIEREGKEPSAKYMQRVIKKAKELEIKRIFVEPQFPKRSAEYIAKKLKGEVVTIDPLAEDWEKNILKIARAIGNGN